MPGTEMGRRQLHPDAVVPAVLREQRVNNEAAEREANKDRHEWTMVLTYAMSEGAAREMMTGERSDNAGAWKATRDGLVSIEGPRCAKCEHEYGASFDRPCAGPRMIGASRAEKRRARRLQDKRGIHATISDDELARLIRQQTDPLAAPADQLA